MRVLIIENSPRQIASAKAWIKEVEGEHEVVLVNTWCDADRQIGLSRPRDTKPFDLVMTDLYMPLTANDVPLVFSQEFKDSHPDSKMPVVVLPAYEHPVGLSAAVLAISLNYARMVAIVTDTNHHNDPMSSTLDAIQINWYPSRTEGKIVIARYPPVSSIVYWDARSCRLGFYDPATGIDYPSGDEALAANGDRHGGFPCCVKNWGEVFRVCKAHLEGVRESQK